MKKVSIILFVVFSLFLWGCTANESPKSMKDITYKELEGLSDASIQAIDKVKGERRALTYGHLYNTEGFRLSDGSYAGFSIALSEQLSKFFGKEIIIEHYYDYERLKSDLESGYIDFSGEFSSDEVSEGSGYYMSSPIAVRPLYIFTERGHEKLENESDLTGKTIAFVLESAKLERLRSAYDLSHIRQMPVLSAAQALGLLQGGQIDAFVMEGIKDTELPFTESIEATPFFPLVSTAVSISTTREELLPFIEAIDTYIENGGMSTYFDLYDEGKLQYLSYKLTQELTKSEREYISEHVASGESIQVSIYNDFYPVSFYNSVSGELEGISPEILQKIQALTGLSFSYPSQGHSNYNEMKKGFDSSQTSMAAGIIYTKSRAEGFLWSDDYLLSAPFVIVTRKDYRDLALHEIVYMNIGTLEKSAHEEIFRSLFPDQDRQHIYKNSFEGFSALENGEIDGILVSENLLLGQTNYFERMSFKANVLVGSDAKAYFAYALDEEQLCTIIDKAMRYIDSLTISRKWLGQSFDYSKQSAEQNMTIALAFAALMGAAFVFTLYISVKMRAKNKELLQRSVEAVEASDVKSLFLAKVSHELRTPLNAIIGMSEIMLREPLNKKQIECATDINSASLSLLELINVILDFTKLEKGKYELSPINFLYSPFINDICAMLHYMAGAKGIEFIYEQEGEIPECLFYDNISLRQILTNICGNAIKFTKEGYVRLSVQAAEDKLVFTVEDTGIGINEENLNKLFSSFTRALELETRSITGTGLGLALSKSLTQMMGGRLSLKSVYGEGSTFTINLPLSVGDPSELEPRKKEEKLFAAPDARVLVVDDSELNLRVASSLLALFEIESVSAKSGDEAISIMKHNRFDIVFMDHMMPGKSGIETVREIRRMGPFCSKSIIIALTADAFCDVKQVFLENGFDGFITKPILKRELAQVLHKFLPKHKITAVKEEKQERVNEIQSSKRASYINKPQSRELLTVLAGLPSIDIENVRERFLGDEQIYEEAISIFLRRLSDECDEMIAFLMEGNVKAFSIAIHSMKTSLYSIGALELSNVANDLELAAKNRDVNTCARSFPDFLREINKLKSELEDALEGIM